MDWSLQNNFSEDYRDSSSETVTEVVACLWAASERFQNQGDSTNAILVLSKLICSRFGCASLEVELGTRLRLAELCSTRVEYCEIAMEQLNRAWAITSHGKNIEDILIELFILKLKDMVYWTRFQASKSKNEAIQCLKFVNQGFQLCTIPNYSVLSFKTYFLLRKSEIIRSNGDLGDHEAVIAKTNYSLPPSRALARWNPNDRKNYEKCHVFCAAVVSLRKSIYMIEKFQNTEATQEISSIRAQMTQNGLSSESIDALVKCAELCILFNEAKFVLALKKLQQIQFQDFKKIMELECLRYIGSAKALKMAEEYEDCDTYESLVYQMRHLRRIEAKFSISIQFGKIAQGLQWLSKWRTQCIEYWPKKASNSLEATYWVMNGTLAASCGKFEFAHSCFSLALSIPLLPSHRTTILCHIGLVDMQMNLDSPVLEMKKLNEMVPCERWYHLKAASLRSDHIISHVLNEMKVFNQSCGSLPLEIWIGIQMNSVPTHTVKLAKNASYIEGEYYSSQKILMNAEEGDKMSLSKLQSILDDYLSRVDLLDC